MPHPVWGHRMNWSWNLAYSTDTSDGPNKQLAGCQNDESWNSWKRETKEWCTNMTMGFPEYSSKGNSWRWLCFLNGWLFQEDIYSHNDLPSKKINKGNAVPIFFCVIRHALQMSTPAVCRIWLEDTSVWWDFIAIPIVAYHSSFWFF
jgi:hypothetical protein